MFLPQLTCQQLMQSRLICIYIHQKIHIAPFLGILIAIFAALFYSAAKNKPRICCVQYSGGLWPVISQTAEWCPCLCWISFSLRHPSNRIYTAEYIQCVYIYIYTYKVSFASGWTWRHISSISISKVSFSFPLEKNVFPSNKLEKKAYIQVEVL